MSGVWPVRMQPPGTEPCLPIVWAHEPDPDWSLDVSRLRDGLGMTEDSLRPRAAGYG